MSVEKGLESVRRSSVTWLTTSIIGLVVILTVNAKGLYDTVDQIKQVQVAQHEVSDRLEANQQSLSLQNATLAARLDADEKRLTYVEDREIRKP